MPANSRWDLIQRLKGYKGQPSVPVLSYINSVHAPPHTKDPFNIILICSRGSSKRFVRKIKNPKIRS